MKGWAVPGVAFDTARARGIGEHPARNTEYGNPDAADLVAAPRLGADHAAIPKKSFAVTFPPVASAMRPMISRSGMRLPTMYRRTVSELTLILAAN
jgi:hypothetical protein